MIVSARAARIGRTRLLQRALRRDGQEGFDLRIDRFDARQRCLRQFQRGYRASPQQRCGIGQRKRSQLSYLRVHGSSR